MMKKRLLWLAFPALIGITVVSCQKEEDLTSLKSENVLVSFEEIITDENSRKINKSLRVIAENLSKADKATLQKISEDALKRYDGDNNFIYHKSKKMFSKGVINSIEEGVDEKELNNPYLNVYVYKGLDNENQDLKPYIFYFPVGIKDTEVDSLIGFIDGKLIKIDAKNPPKDIKNPIFVVGENERMHEVETESDESFVVNNKIYAIKERYLTSDEQKSNNLTKKGGYNKMRVTFSRFGSMSDKRHYEPWGKGDAEVRFIFNKSYYAHSFPYVYPIDNMDMETSSALIDGGYMYRKWWNYYSKDNYSTTPYFVDFYSENTQASYTMTLIEEDRYWGWIENFLNSSRKEPIKFIHFKTTLLDNLNINTNNIYEPSVRQIYNDLRNADNFEDLKNAYNKLRTNSKFYFDITHNMTAQNETNIKSSLLLAMAQATIELLDHLKNTDDKMGDPITISRENGKIYYTTDKRFRFKLEY